MGIYVFRTDHLGAYNDIYRVLVTLVVGHLYVSAAKAFAVQLDYLQLRHFQNSWTIVKISAVEFTEVH